VIIENMPGIVCTTNHWTRTLVFGLLCLTAASVFPQAGFYSLETHDLRLLYYGKLQAFVAPYVAQCYENSLKFHSELFEYTPSNKTTLFLHDFSDYGNAGASTVPWNKISLAIAPPSYAFETTPSNERVNATLNHEVIHLVVNDKAAGTDKFFRSLFCGKVRETSDHPLTILYAYLTTPRRSSPRWYQEGIAVFLDTWMAGGLGRAQGGYDEMVFRTMVRDTCEIFDLVGLEAKGTQIDFQVGVNSYLYGTRFMSYLAYYYGPECLIEWVSRTKDSKRYYAAQFKKTFGFSVKEAWSDWIEWERQFQQEQLDSIRQYPTTPGRDLSEQALGSVSPGCWDPIRGKLFAAVSYPGQVAYIAAINVVSGRLEKICDIKGPALYVVSSIALDPATGSLFYTTDNDQWRDLRVVNVDTRESRTLMKDVRIGDLVFNAVDSSLWGVRHFNGITTVTRIPHPYTEWNQVYSSPYGNDIYNIAISPDGEYLSAGLAEISGRQSLVRWSIEGLLQGNTLHDTLFDFGNSIPANFVFSPSGESLFGASYSTGVSNIFRYDFGTREMEAVSNCESGFFNPVPVSDDSLIVCRYSGKGFVPVMIADTTLEDVSAVRFLGRLIAEKHPIVRSWLAGPPSSIDLDSIKVYEGPYSSIRNIRLASVYPVVDGYGDYVAYGVRLNLRGPIALHELDLTTSYSPNHRLPEKERLHLSANYGHLGWKVRFKYNAADFYDLFGPTKTARKGYSLGVSFNRTLYLDGPRSLNMGISSTGYGGLRELPAYQNITTSYSGFVALRGNLGYRNMRASLGAVNYEKGFQWRLVPSFKFVKKKVFPQVYTSWDLGFPLPINHSSIWLRNSIGFSPGDRAEPLASFYFGGFGNNWVDSQPEQRYRAHYSFPGVEINDIGGTTFGKTMLEWALPPVRFRHLGLPTFYAMWARISLFGSAIVTNIGSGDLERQVGNLGGQLDLRMILLSHLKATLSVGFAVAFEEQRKARDEFMVSLKIL
jgi:hypothetical protein